MSALSGDQVASLLYLVLLGAVLLVWFFADFRNSASKTLQHAALWGLIFLGAIAVAGLWSDIRRHSLKLPSVSEDGVIEIPRGPDGHYEIDARVNGASIRFLVDTGASMIVLSKPDAARAGIDVEALTYLGTAATANGQVAIANIRADTFELGPIRESNLRMTVNGGALDGSLLGMSFLERFSELRIVGDRMLLIP